MAYRMMVDKLSDPSSKASKDLERAIALLNGLYEPKDAGWSQEIVALNAALDIVISTVESFAGFYGCTDLDEDE